MSRVPIKHEQEIGRWNQSHPFSFVGTKGNILTVDILPPESTKAIPFATEGFSATLITFIIARSISKGIERKKCMRASATGF